MLDYLKQISEAWTQRIRSPFWGSIILVFVGVNWQALAYLFWASEPLLEKFEYFDQNTNENSLYLVPILFGVALALVTPWLSFIGAWLAKFPRHQLNTLQIEAARSLRITEYQKSAAEEEALAKLESAREDRKIASEKRLQEAKNLSKTLSTELQNERTVESQQGATKLTPVQALDFTLNLYAGFDLFSHLLDERNGRGILQKEDSRKDVYSFFVVGGKAAATCKNRFEHERIKGTLDKLVANGILTKSALSGNLNGNSSYALTPFGYEVGQHLEKK